VGPARKPQALYISPLKLSALENLFRMSDVALVDQWFLKDPVPKEWIINILTALNVNTFGLPDFLVISKQSYI